MALNCPKCGFLIIPDGSVQIRYEHAGRDSQALVRALRRYVLEDVVRELEKFKLAGRRAEFDAADIRALL